MFGPVLTNDGSMCFAWCSGVLVVDGLGLWLFSSLRPVLFAFFFFFFFFFCFYYSRPSVWLPWNFMYFRPYAYNYLRLVDPNPVPVVVVENRGGERTRELPSPGS